MWVGSLFVAAVSYGPFFALFRRPAARGRTEVTFMFVIAATVGLALGLMLAWHTYLVATNQTTIEFYVNRMHAKKLRTQGQVFRNPHDLGVARNWEMTLGSHPLSVGWLMPSLQAPQGNGVEYPTVFEPDIREYRDFSKGGEEVAAEEGTAGREASHRPNRTVLE